jgi:hypothetical protein
MVSGVKLHSLPAGYRFDLDDRRLITVAGEGGHAAFMRSGQRRLRNLVRQIAAEGADTRAPERRERRRLYRRPSKRASE